MSIRAKKVAATMEELLDPGAPGWRSIKGEKIEMSATPLANQPSEYIKASRDERKIGKVKQIEVKACHNGKEVFIRIEWKDSIKNTEVKENNTFPDATGILFPVDGEPPVDEMGAKEKPVNAWYWRADFEDKPKNVWARGLGTTEYSEKSFIKARSKWEGGKWQVVLARAFSVPLPEEQSVKLTVGKPARVAFAVWAGDNGERAGVKSFSKEWRDLVLEG
jgi:DMSO reductase family type II enzyme heme b subunit